MSDSPVLFERVELDSGAAYGLLRLNRPRALNAINSALLAALEDVLRQQRQAGLCALVITGAGDKAFAAGADISEMSAYSAVMAEQFARQGQQILGLIEHFPAPTIAAVNGFALGGGCELAMCCDIVLAGARAVFGQPEVKLGLIPGFGGTQRLVRRVGRQRALELMMTGRNVKADQAVAYGLALPAEGGDALQAAHALVAEIARNAPVAVRLVKRAVHDTDRLDLEAGLAAEASLFGLAFATDDHAEGIGAFLDKRQAIFKGA